MACASQTAFSCCALRAAPGRTGAASPGAELIAPRAPGDGQNQRLRDQGSQQIEHLLRAAILLSAPTASPAPSVQPPENTGQAREQQLLRDGEQVKLQSRVARSVCWRRGAVRLPATSRRKRSS